MAAAFREFVVAPFLPHAGGTLGDFGGGGEALREAFKLLKEYGEVGKQAEGQAARVMLSRSQAAANGERVRLHSAGLPGIERGDDKPRPVPLAVGINPTKRGTTRLFSRVELRVASPEHFNVETQV